eukprot:2779754-Rhodomonas_salina.2
MESLRAVWVLERELLSRGLAVREVVRARPGDFPGGAGQAGRVRGRPFGRAVVVRGTAVRDRAAVAVVPRGAEHALQLPEPRDREVALGAGAREAAVR